MSLSPLPARARTTTPSSARDRTQSQWLFTAEDLKKTPSVVEGMPVAQEALNRQKGVNFITQVGIMLKLPQLTLATASVFLHRFYMRKCMQLSKTRGLHHYQVAATALFLATKVEENCRKMREIVVACCRVAQKQPNLVIDEQSKEYWSWRDTILHNEDVLLEALCFDLQLEQPYRILFHSMCDYGVQDNKVLRNAAWAFLNDSHVTTLCLLQTPRAIAGAALYAGAKLAGTLLPDDEHGRPWWDSLDLDIHEIQRACNIMAEVYENPAVPRQGQKDAYIKDDDVLSFERTRLTQSPRFDRSPAHSVRSTSQGLKREREDDGWGEATNDDGPRDGPVKVSPEPGPHTAARSPKRVRYDPSNGPTTDVLSSSRIPPSAHPTPDKVVESKVEAGSDHDRVQRRIDDIVNASVRTNGTDTKGGADGERISAAPPARHPRQIEGQREGNHVMQSNGASHQSLDRRGSVEKGSEEAREDDNVEADEVDHGSEEGEV